MAEESEAEQLVHRLYQQVSDHLETRWTYLSLSFTEKVSAISGDLAGAFVLAIFGLLALFFFSFGFAWWLGDFLSSRALGFALTGLIFIPIAVFVFRWIRPFVRDKVIEVVLQEENSQNQDQDE